MLAEASERLFIVLDACRYDEFARICSGSQCVRSCGSCTGDWLRALMGWLRTRKPVYFTANPVPSNVLKKAQAVRTVDLWRRHWGLHSDALIPSVHPESVNAVVVNKWAELKDKVVVVHYLQPHMPYIGGSGLGFVNWGPNCGGTLGDALRTYPTLHSAVKRAELSWKRVREAYRANLRLAWRAAYNLVHSVRVPAIVTSDHGEFLGENGEFGHPGGIHDARLRRYANHNILREVPYLKLEPEARVQTVEQRLAALGYR